MTHPFASEHYQKMALEARQLVRQWVNESQSIKPTFAAEQLAGVLRTPMVFPSPSALLMALFAPRTTTSPAATFPVFLAWHLPSCPGT